MYLKEDAKEFSGKENISQNLLEYNSFGANFWVFKPPPNLFFSNNYFSTIKIYISILLSKITLSKFQEDGQGAENNDLSPPETVKA